MAVKKTESGLRPGLVNLGNTCYFNSVIQALAVSEPLTEILAEDGDLPVKNQLHELLSTLATSSAGQVNPRDLYQEIARRRGQFNDYTQEDAHELLSCLLDELRSEQVAHVDRLERSRAGVDEEDLNAVRAWQKRQRHRPGRRRPYIDDIFAGQLASIVVCDVCHKVKIGHEEFLHLSLPIKPEVGSEQGEGSAKERLKRREDKGLFRLPFGKHELGRGNSLNLKQRRPKPVKTDDGYLSEADAPHYEKAKPTETVDLSSLVDQSLRLERQDSRRKSLDSAREIVDSTSSMASSGKMKRKSRLGFGWGLKKVSSTSAVNGRDGPPQIIEPLPDDLEPKSSANSSKSHLSQSSDKSRLQTLLAPISIERPLSPAASDSASQTSHRNRRPSHETTVSALASAFGFGLGGNVSGGVSTSTGIGTGSGSGANGSGGAELDKMASSLYDCLVHFTAVETLQGENAFACTSCWRKANPEEARKIRARRIERQMATGRRGENVTLDSSDSSTSSTSSSSESDTTTELTPQPNGRPHQSRVRSSRSIKMQSRSILRSAQKRYLIATCPPILIIQLKRFQQFYSEKSFFSSNSEIGTKKIDEWIEYPEELDLTPFIEPPDPADGTPTAKSFYQASTTSCRYRLYAVVVHIGSISGGHYVSYIHANRPMKKSSNEDKEHDRHWIFCSDTTVRKASLAEVLRARAYLCFYERLQVRHKG